MKNHFLLTDSLNAINQTIEITAPANPISWLDTVCKIATVIIALANVALVIYIFIKNRERDVSYKEKSRKLNLLKTLVLDYSMDNFYEFFENIVNETNKLKNKDLDKNGKQIINDTLLLLGRDFEQKFIDLFLGINQKLHEQIKQKTDNLIDDFTESIFNENINIYTDDNFTNFVTNRIILSKTQIIKILFNYSGEEI